MHQRTCLQQFHTIFLNVINSSFKTPIDATKWDGLLSPKCTMATLTALFYSFLYNLCHKHLCLLLAKKSVVSVQLQAALASWYHRELHALSKCFFMINTRVSSSALLCTLCYSQVTNSLLRMWRLEIWSKQGWHQTKIPSSPTCYTFLFSIHKNTLSLQASQTTLQVNATSCDSTASFS